jgi:hypothetical protein
LRKSKKEGSPGLKAWKSRSSTPLLIISESGSGVFKTQRSRTVTWNPAHPELIWIDGEPYDPYPQYAIRHTSSSSRKRVALPFNANSLAVLNTIPPIQGGQLEAIKDQVRALYNAFTGHRPNNAARGDRSGHS